MTKIILNYITAALLTGSSLTLLLTAGCSDPSPSERTTAAIPLPDLIRAAAEERFTSIDRLSGAVVGVKIGDTVVARFPLGHADDAAQSPMTLDHVFHAASVTKPFLGVVALRLVEEGTLDLDAPISRYLPDAPHADAVTVRMLGNNTSGYFNAISDPAFRSAIEADPPHLWTADEILQYVFDKPLTIDAPGKAWAYSNSNAVVLGEVIRAATGEHWSTSLRRLIADPLKLNSIGVEEGGAPNNPRDPASPLRLPKGYRFGQRDSAMEYGNVYLDASAFSPSWAGAAGSMHATLDDLLAAAEPVLGGSLLADNTRAVQHGWLDTGYSSEDGLHSRAEKIYYGFLVGKRRIGEQDFIGHPGDVPGFSSFVAYEPQTRTSIVVLCNLSNTPHRLIPAEEIAEAIIAAMQSQPGTDMQSR